MNPTEEFTISIIITKQNFVTLAFRFPYKSFSSDCHNSSNKYHYIHDLVVRPFLISNE